MLLGPVFFIRSTPPPTPAAIPLRSSAYPSTTARHSKAGSTL